MEVVGEGLLGLGEGSGLVNGVNVVDSSDYWKLLRGGGGGGKEGAGEEGWEERFRKGHGGWWRGFCGGERKRVLERENEEA